MTTDSACLTTTVAAVSLSTSLSTCLSTCVSTCVSTSTASVPASVPAPVPASVPASIRRQRWRVLRERTSQHGTVHDDQQRARRSDSNDVQVLDVWSRLFPRTTKVVDVTGPQLTTFHGLNVVADCITVIIFRAVISARSQLHKVLFLALSVTFLFVYEISREPLNGFAPYSQGRLSRTSLKVKVKGQGRQRQTASPLKMHCFALATNYVVQQKGSFRRHRGVPAVHRQRGRGTIYVAACVRLCLVKL